MATGFDIDEEDYNWVDISKYGGLDPMQRFTKRVLELGNEEDYDDPGDYYDWVDLLYFREFGD